MKRFILIVVMIMCATLTGCEEIKKEEIINVDATVIDTQYQAMYTVFIPIFNGKSIIVIPQVHPAEYNVTISYEDVSKTFNDKNLFMSVKDGDTIKMELHKYYDKDDTLVYEELQFPE